MAKATDNKKGPVAQCGGSLKDGARFRKGDVLPANLSNDEHAQLVKLGAISKGGK